MPLGFERLNERSQRPNALINFIKPLEGQDKAVAEDFLYRIAAQCYPVMKAAHVSVMSLEEFPANNEFLGRNFNAGECIQLVLKDKSGRWLGFKYVQMVMMHELAHCKQMNHSRSFWQVRNQYAQEMHDLWAKKYSGEGVWGRGQDLRSGRFVMDREVDANDVPEHLCGGTYRRRGRKRKKGAVGAASDGQRPSYAERQQRRIAKKFGKHGEGSSLGEDELIRGALEQGHRHSGKPRVASSKRGRELRAQAALARFDAAKVQHPSKASSTTEGVTDEDETEVEWSDSDVDDAVQDTDRDGFVKICEGEDDKDEDASNEMDELRAMTSKNSSSTTSEACSRKPAKIKGNTQLLLTDAPASQDVKPETSLHKVEPAPQIVEAVAPADQPEIPQSTDHSTQHTDTLTNNRLPNIMLCPICSLENESSSLLCMACAHVLRPKLVSNTWQCSSAACQGTSYLNAGDAGRCGICGNLKPKVVSRIAAAVRPISSDVLRWD